MSHGNDKNLSFVQPGPNLWVHSMRLPLPPHVLKDSEEATHRHCTRVESQTEGWHRQPAVVEASGKGARGYHGTALT